MPLVPIPSYDYGLPGPGQDILDFCIEFFPVQQEEAKTWTQSTDLIRYLLRYTVERQKILTEVYKRSRRPHPRFFCIIHPILRQQIIIHSHTTENEFFNILYDLLYPPSSQGI